MIRDRIEYKGDGTHWIEAKKRMEMYLNKGINVVLEGQQACPIIGFCNVFVTTMAELNITHGGFRGYKEYDEVCKIAKKHTMKLAKGHIQEDKL